MSKINENHFIILLIPLSHCGHCFDALLIMCSLCAHCVLMCSLFAKMAHQNPQDTPKTPKQQKLTLKSVDSRKMAHQRRVELPTVRLAVLAKALALLYVWEQKSVQTLSKRAACESNRPKAKRPQRQHLLNCKKQHEKSAKNNIEIAKKVQKTT